MKEEPVQFKTLQGKTIVHDGRLESRHKIGDTVTITAKVAGIQFSDSKVHYVFDLGEHLSIVDSEHVEPAQPVGKD